MVCGVARPQLLAQAPRSPAAQGALLIVSDPAGADVYVDGQRVGASPVSLPAVVAGDHRVRVVKDGYLEHSRVVNTNARKPITLQVRLTARPGSATGAQSASLKIVVVEGEDAVNIIQQKSAVAPVVEVRDKNNQPVGGVIVRFAIRGGRATFNGARTLSVTTNAAGRAAVSGLTPTSSGAFQISASAAFQGQTAAITIAQTNVLTAVEAATAASAGGASGAGGSATAGAGGTGSGAGGSAGASAGGAAGGGTGGSLSATTLGIVGGAAAGGTLVAVRAVGGDGASGTIYTGAFSGPLTWTFPGPPSCTRTEQNQGTLTLRLDVAADGGVTGEAEVDGASVVVALNCGGGPQLNARGTLHSGPTPVTGTTSRLVFNWQGSNSFQNTPTTPDGTHTVTFSFTGTLTGSEISGALTHTERADAPGFTPGTGSATYPVTLR